MNPKHVDLHVGKGLVSARKHRPLDTMPLARVLRRTFKAEPFIVPASDYAPPKPIDELLTFRRIADLARCWPDVERSLWFQQLCDDIARDGSARHKHRTFSSPEAAAAFLTRYGEDLLGSMAREGYVLRDGDDLPFCFIGPRGDIHKAHKGRHRLSAARVVGVERFPMLVVGMHEQFYSETVGRRLDLDGIRDAIRQVEAQAR